MKIRVSLVLLLSILAAASWSLPVTTSFGKLFDLGIKGADSGTDVAVDGSGNSYIVCQTTLGDYCLWVVRKYDPYGNQIWSQSLNFFSIASSPRAIDCDDLGNVWVMGQTRGGNGTRDDVGIAKLSPIGYVEWVRNYDGGAGDGDYPLALTHDGAGNVRVAAVAVVLGPKLALAVIAYDLAGKSVPALSFTLLDHYPVQAVFSPSGNLAFAGTDQTSGNREFILLDPNHNVLKSENGAPPAGQTWNYSVWADPTGNVEVVKNTSTAGQFSFELFIYNQAGMLVSATPAQAGSLSRVSASSASFVYGLLQDGTSQHLAKITAQGIPWFKVGTYTHVAADGANGVIVARQGPGEEPTINFLDKYSPTGVFAWSTATIAPTGFTFAQTSVLKARVGNAYYLGQAGTTNGNSVDVIYRKYVQGPALATITTATASVGSAANLLGAINLNTPFTVANQVELGSSNPAALNVPAVVPIGANQASAGFQATAGVVDGDTSVVLSARLKGVQRNVVVTVLPAALTSLTMPVATITGGTNVAATVQLGGLAGSAGRTVTLKSSNTALATVPASVKVLPWHSSATFTVATKPGGNGTVSISATALGKTVAKNLKVTP